MRVYFYVIISWIIGLDPYAPIEKSLEKRLMDAVPGIESAHIRISASRFMFLMFGKCRGVTVELRAARVSGLRLDFFSFVSTGFRFNPFSTFFLNRPVILEAGDTEWTIRVLEEDLEDFLDTKGPLLKGAEVSITPERITLCRPSSLAALLHLKEPLSLSGRIAIDEKKCVVLDLSFVQSFGISPARPLLKTILNIVNPILTPGDVNRLLNKVESGPLSSVKLKALFEEILMLQNHILISGRLLSERVPKKKPEPKPAEKTIRKTRKDKQENKKEPIAQNKD